LILNSLKLVITYTLFALISIVANIGIQDIVIRFYSGPLNIPISIINGTCVGLIIKYVLDKKYIFRFKAENVVKDSQTFMLYVFMGLFTTAIFLGFELGFDYLFHTKNFRYLGAVIGLTIGYITKYHLDKRFVFRKEILG
jgi:putative flippase GtrA